MQAVMTSSVSRSSARFDSLMKENYRKAYSFAYRMSGNREEAEDLTQEAFVRAYRAFERYDASRPFERWLFRIIANLFVDKLRSRPKQSLLSLDSPLEGHNGDAIYSEIADVQADPMRHVVETVLDERIQGALNALPAPFRETVILTDVEGMGYDEAAELLGCAVGTIRSRLHRARVMMRNHLLGNPKRKQQLVHA